MSSYQTQFGATNFNSASDADLLLRLGIALAARQRAAWRVVQVRAQDGIVRLEGFVPTFYDRQLIVTVARHVAGVLRVEDELAIVEPPARSIAEPPARNVAEPPTRKQETATEDPSSTNGHVPVGHGGSDVKAGPPLNAFYHLPVLDESLEDILAKRAQSAAAAS